MHSITTSTRPTSFNSTLPEADKIRLIAELISTNTLQGMYCSKTRLDRRSGVEPIRRCIPQADSASLLVTELGDGLKESSDFTTNK